MLEQGVRELRDELGKVIASGCAPASSKFAFLRELVESLPLDAALAQQIVLGPYGTQDYIDIEGPVGLHLTYPLDAIHPGNYSSGYAERSFTFVATEADGRGRLEPGKLRVVAPGTPGRLPAPPLDLTSHGSARHFRLFLVVRCGGGGDCGATSHDAALLTADTHTALQAATALLLREPHACARLAVAGATCQPVPLFVQLEARVKVLVNGTAVSVPLPATVAMALAAATGSTDGEAPPILRVFRDYRGQLVRVVPDGGAADLMSLRLIGGERIVTNSDQHR